MNTQSQLCSKQTQFSSRPIADSLDRIASEAMRALALGCHTELRKTLQDCLNKVPVNIDASSSIDAAQRGAAAFYAGADYEDGPLCPNINLCDWRKGWMNAARGTANLSGELNNIVTSSACTKDMLDAVKEHILFQPAMSRDHNNHRLQMANRTKDAQEILNKITALHSSFTREGLPHLGQTK